jgi:hypothetical protein
MFKADLLDVLKPALSPRYHSYKVKNRKKIMPLPIPKRGISI